MRSNEYLSCNTAGPWEDMLWRGPLRLDLPGVDLLLQVGQKIFRTPLSVGHFGFSALLFIFMSQNVQAECSSYPISVGSNDALITMLPDGGVGPQYTQRGSRTAAPTGSIVFDSDDGKLKICTGTSWSSLAATPSLMTPVPTDYQGDVSWGNDLRVGKSGLTPVGGNSDGWWSTTRWKQVASGGKHTCAIRESDNRLFCWGDNTFGQLGDGTNTNRIFPGPLASTGGWDATAWSEVFTGFDHTCALRLADSYLFCWGYNLEGGLGDGTTTNRNAPVALTSTGGWNATAWSRVSAGGQNTCAIRSSDSRLFCWGKNLGGKLGDGTTTDRSAPTALASAGGWNTTAWSSVDTKLRTCAIRQSDSYVFCWGDNTQGQIGDGTTTERNTPTALTATGGWNTTAFDFVVVGSAMGSVCGRRSSDQRLFCWGANSFGEVGDGTMTSPRTSPVALTTTNGWNTTVFSKVSVGANYVCALRDSDKRMFCWGSNASGRLGDGTEINRSIPTSLVATGGWSETAWHDVSTRDQTCGLRSSDRRIFCWGGNSDGQLGNGSTVNSSVPQPLSNRTVNATQTWSQVSAGDNHVCALRSSDSRALCWGGNFASQLGTGFPKLEALPVELSETDSWNSTAWAQISSGGTHTCARRSADNYIFCWGRGNDGRLGTGNTTNAVIPTPLDSVGGWNTTAWSYVGAGNLHSCAIRSSDSRIFCWGGNSHGQLGDGTLISKNSPTPLTSTGGWNLTAWSALSVGADHTCAVRSSDSRTFCWGRNLSGRLGDGTTDNRSAPTPLSSAGGFDTTSWTTVSAGGEHTCAIRASDSYIFCWGSGVFGRLGRGNFLDSSDPAPLDSVGGWNTTAWDRLSVGTNSTCARRTSDSLTFCWGSNSGGQLGDGTLSNRNSPVALTSSNGWNTTVFSHLSVGTSTVCAIRQSDSKLFCWGSNANSKLGQGTIQGESTSPVEVAAVGGFEAISWYELSGGQDHLCGIRADNRTIQCWGDGGNGRLGNGNGSAQVSPTSLSSSGGFDIETWLQVSAGFSHTCAIRQSDSRLFCWGDGSNGKLGNGITGQQLSPVSLTTAESWNTTAWRKVVASDLHTCAIRAKDSVLFCWGSGNNGRLGNGATTGSLVPAPLAEPFAQTAWRDVELGRAFTCAIRASDDRMFCWGQGASGRLGNGLSADVLTPGPLVAPFDVTAWESMAMGDGHNCAIRKSDRRIYCWGVGGNGQLGTGTSPFGQSTPIPLAAGFETTAWTRVRAKSNSTCAIRASDDRVFCWGANSQGEVGDGTRVDRDIPTAVGGIAASIAFQDLTMTWRGVLGLPKSSGSQSACTGGQWLHRTANTNLTLQMKASGSQTFASRLFQTAVENGTLTYNDEENRLSVCSNGVWNNFTTSAGGACLSSADYPTGSGGDGVLSFLNVSLMGLLTRTSTGDPKPGALIYNSTTNRLQLCDGSNWRTLDVE